MENQELMRLCFRIAWLMEAAKNGFDFHLPELKGQNEIWLTAKQITLMLRQYYDENPPSLELVTAALQNAHTACFLATKTSIDLTEVKYSI